MFTKNRLHTNVWPLAFAVAVASYTPTTAGAGSRVADRTSSTTSAARAAAPQASSLGETMVQLAQVQLRTQRKRRRIRRSRRPRSRATATGPTKDIPGRYAILRAKNKDAGCLLSLNRSGRAQIGPGCQDHGIQIFDPVRWRWSKGLLVLRARAGHRISFSRNPDGTWQRSPAGKKALGLRKY